MNGRTFEIKLNYNVTTLHYAKITDTFILFLITAFNGAYGYNLEIKLGIRRKLFPFLDK